MRFNPVDIVCIILVSTVAAIQFMRGRENVGLIFFETLAIIGAGKVGFEASKLNHSFALFFFTSLIIFLIVARLLYNIFPFSFGIFDTLFSFLLGIVGGWGIGFGLGRSLIPLILKNPALTQMVAKSWMASQVVFLGVLRELHAMLIQAKYHNLPSPP